MARGWTQQQLAEIANFSLRTVQRVETQSVASNETVSALSAVLEIPRTELMTLSPNQPGADRGRAKDGATDGGNGATRCRARLRHHGVSHGLASRQLTRSKSH